MNTEQFVGMTVAMNKQAAIDEFNKRQDAVEKFIADIKSAWAEVFPNSHCSARNFLGSTCFVGRLAKDYSECANRIIENDPLNYAGWYRLDDGDVYKEDRADLFVKPPVGANLVYGRAKLRNKSIKQPDRAKLVKRFLELREFIRSEKDNMINLHFDINQKV